MSECLSAPIGVYCERAENPSLAAMILTRNYEDECPLHPSRIWLDAPLFQCPMVPFGNFCRLIFGFPGERGVSHSDMLRAEDEDCLPFRMSSKLCRLQSSRHPRCAEVHP
jgi:hypothetical protein